MLNLYQDREPEVIIYLYLPEIFILFSTKNYNYKNEIINHIDLFLINLFLKKLLIK